ncbi:MAG: alpha/beta fold hydrolase [Thermonemataceae bacterium]
METLHIPTQDQFTLAASVFTPTQSNGKAILINSATAVKRQYYRHFAQYLAQQGYWVYTYDYRGIGDSRPRSLKGFEAYMHQWGTQDFEAMMRYLQQQHPTLSYFLVGHSVGGQLVGLSKQSLALKAMVFVASQVGYWKYWKDLKGKAFMLSTMYAFIPTLSQLFGYLPTKSLGLMEDLPYGVAREWSKWCRNPDYLFKYFNPQSYFFSKIKAPILTYSFSDDMYAPHKAVENLLTYYSSAAITHQKYTPQLLNTAKIGHFGFFKKSFPVAKWQQIADWLDTF